MPSTGLSATIPIVLEFAEQAKIISRDYWPIIAPRFPRPTDWGLGLDWDRGFVQGKTVIAYGFNPKTNALAGWGIQTPRGTFIVADQNYRGQSAARLLFAGQHPPKDGLILPGGKPHTVSLRRALMQLWSITALQGNPAAHTQTPALRAA